MPIFQRYLLKELIQNALVTFAVITLIFMVGGALRFLHKTELITIATFVRAVFFFIGTNLDKTLPMTVLIASVLTYGRAAADNELNTMKASGIHLATALIPALFFGMAGTAVVLYVNDKVASEMEFRKGELIEAGMDGAMEALMDRGGNAIQLGKNVHVIWRAVDDLGRMHDLRIKRYAKGDENESRPLIDEIMAETAHLVPDHKQGVLYLDLEGVQTLYGEFKGGAAGSLRYPIPLREQEWDKHPKEHSLTELATARGRRYVGAHKIRTLDSEYHQRVAGAFACILFVIVGVPLSIIFRHGNRMVAFLIAFLIAIGVYYPTFMLGELLSDETKISTFLAVWSGSIFLLLLGGGLTVVVFRR